MSEPAAASSLRPDLRVRSNSFNLVPVRDVTRAPGAPCPLKSRQDPPQDRVRAAYLRLRDRMRLYRTATSDFSGAELERIRSEFGQLYADVSTKVAPDDFAADLRKLALSLECRRCDRNGECPGCYVALPDDVFTRDDRVVRELLAAMRGRILDIGCGDGPYAVQLAANVHAGAASYLGVDPDEARVALLAARHPWAEYRAAPLESVFDELVAGPRFDHVLVLRSYNHLPDPERSLGLAVQLLARHGSLTVVDNVAFGLLRSATQARSSEQGALGFEHYRNDSAGDAAARLARLPLRLTLRQDVGPDTSNQWLLRYEKVSEERP